MRWSPASQDVLVLISLGVLVLASVALATYTTSVQERTSALIREATALVSPGVRATEDLIVAVSVEEELHGRPGASGERRRNRVIRTRAMAQLDTITATLGGEARSRYDELSTSLERWEVLTGNADNGGALLESSDAGASELRPLFRTILREGTELQRTLYGELERARRDLDSAERLDWYYTIGLALVAITASVVIAMLVRRIRYLAQQSEQRRLEAEAAITDRARLIRGITHDLKNPLGAADGNAQLLEIGIGGELTGAQREMINRIRRTIGSAVTIVSDLLELGRAETGSLQVERVPTEVGTLLRDIVEDYRSQAEASGISLTSDLPAELPSADTDARRVRQIVGNLLSNAIKFTPSGGHIVLTAGVGVPSGGSPRLEVRVSDDGPGIPAEERERIFEEFYRAGSPGARPAGSGLGLTISRRLARLLGGDLVAESRAGTGSTFRLTLPLSALAGARASEG